MKENIPLKGSGCVLFEINYPTYIFRKYYLNKWWGKVFVQD